LVERAFRLRKRVARLAREACAPGECHRPDRPGLHCFNCAEFLGWQPAHRSRDADRWLRGVRTICSPCRRICSVKAGGCAHHARRRLQCRHWLAGGTRSRGDRRLRKRARCRASHGDIHGRRPASGSNLSGERYLDRHLATAQGHYAAVAGLVSGGRATYSKCRTANYRPQWRCKLPPASPPPRRLGS
jgi:hypothetical protein